MWSEAQLVDDLRDLGLGEGMSVLAHTSLRSVGPIDGGAERLVRAFRKVLGSTGTLMVPTFTFDHCDPTGWRFPPESSEELERLRKALPVFDPASTPADPHWMGIFPEMVRKQPDAYRSSHPIVSFAAIGANAEFLTRQVPFHYPLGADSPLARLHQLDGIVLLLGVTHRVDSSLHLAEVWAEVPYIHRSISVKTGLDQWSVMKGSPECSEGFSKIEPVLRQARLLKQGYVGNAISQAIRQRALVSMAIAMLRGDAASLLCNDPECRWCSVARKLSAPASPRLSDKL